MLAVTFASRHIYLHLINYTRPAFQMHIIRILAMVPIYSVTAFLSLPLRASASSLATLALIRDTYEAYVIYNFVALLIAYGGGDRALIYFLEGKPRLPHVYPLSNFLPPVALDASFIHYVRLGVLQFIVIKPSCAAANLRLVDQPDAPLHILLTIVENLSVTSALYGLVVFYHATHTLLEPHSPLPKFLSVKAVVFLTFWQGIVLKLAVFLTLLPDIAGFPPTDQATGLQDVLICFEMAVASLVHYFVFSYKEYAALAPVSTSRHSHPLLRNFGDIVDIRDVLSDARERLSGGTGFESELRDSEPLLPGADRVLGSLSRDSMSNASLSYDLATAPWNIDCGDGRGFGTFVADVSSPEVSPPASPVEYQGRPRKNWPPK